MDLKHKQFHFDLSVKEKDYKKAEKAKKTVIRKLKIAFVVLLILIPLTYVALTYSSGLLNNTNKKIIYVGALLISFLLSYLLLSLHLTFDIKLNHYLKVVEIYDIVQFLIVSLLIIFFLQIFIFRTSTIVGSSMEPTLFDKDRVMVLQYKYNYKFDDVIVFDAKPYLSGSSDNDEDSDLFIKRIKGLPGQTISLSQIGSTVNYEIIVDGKAIKDYKDRSVIVSNGSSHYSNLDKLINEVEGIIPKDSYFVLGDNTNHSQDSRSLGFILKDDIAGVAFLRLLRKFGLIK